MDSWLARRPIDLNCVFFISWHALLSKYVIKPEKRWIFQKLILWIVMSVFLFYFEFRHRSGLLLRGLWKFPWNRESYYQPSIVVVNDWMLMIWWYFLLWLKIRIFTLSWRRLLPKHLQTYGQNPLAKTNKVLKELYWGAISHQCWA